MARIPAETVQRVIAAADIVDVVGGYVSLKRRGSNHWGLCPFHNERTPSFAVSKAKGIFKCFSCGKSGGAVGFIMEMEQMSYTDAIKHLAARYGIPIEERELTSEEKEAEDKRMAMLALNQMAAEWFHNCLLNTEEGRNIGLAYFRERGINDDMIERFQLGYAPDSFDAFLKMATSKGYSEDLLVETGLCSRNEKGRVYDRFRGRVIYPVMSVSGKPVAFGGRVLSKGKVMAKYVNSPESIIYSKRRELYGLFQAKRAISKDKKCLLVEGYMDVISMAQSGICNIVASSGTSLTTAQANLIHRFADNVTLIYDSDPAGIKASLRGIDILLAEGLKIKVVQLPEGDDPDSFAQTHSASEVEEYIAANELDFIHFKTDILLAGAEGDPLVRASVIKDIVSSISVIPDEITRMVYVQECAQRMKMAEEVLSRQVAINRNEELLKLRRDEQRMRETGKLPADEKPAAPAASSATAEASPAKGEKPAAKTDEKAGASKPPYKLRRFELQLLCYAVRYGNVAIAADVEGDDAPAVAEKVVDIVRRELESDEIWFVHNDIAHAFDAVSEAVTADWAACEAAELAGVDAEIERLRADGINEIRSANLDLNRIERAEANLEEQLAEKRIELWNNRCSEFMSTRLVNHPDDTVRSLASSLMVPKYRLSKIHEKYGHVADERERLADLLYRSIFEFKDAILGWRIEQQTALLASNPGPEELGRILADLADLNSLRAEFARCLGDRIILPTAKQRR